MQRHRSGAERPHNRLRVARAQLSARNPPVVLKVIVLWLAFRRCVRAMVPLLLLGTVNPATCAGGFSGSRSAEAKEFPLTSVNWTKVMNRALCEPGSGAAVIVRYVRPRGSSPLALVQAECSAGAGYPPSSLWLFNTASSPTDAHLMQRLLAPGWFMELGNVHAGGQQISAEVDQDMGGCCFSYRYGYKATWRWDDNHYVGEPAQYTGPSPLQVTVSHSRAAVRLGQRPTFSIRVRNDSRLTVSDVEVAPGPSLAKGVNLKCWQSACPLGTLHPGQTGRITWSAAANTAPVFAATFAAGGNVPTRGLNIVVTPGAHVHLGRRLPQLSISSASATAEMSVTIHTCIAQNLLFRLRRGLPSNGSQALVLVFANTGKGACYLYGYPTVKISGGSRGVKVTNTSPNWIGLPRPNVSEPVRLPSGGQSSSTLFYTTGSGKTCDPLAGTDVIVRLVNVKGHFEGHRSIDICANPGDLRVTTEMTRGTREGSY